MDLDDGIAGIMFAGEQGLQFDGGDEVIQASNRRGQVGPDILTLPCQLQVGLGFFPGLLEVFRLGDGYGDSGPALLDLPGLVLIVPDLRVAQFLLYRLEAALFVLDIK